MCTDGYSYDALPRPTQIVSCANIAATHAYDERRRLNSSIRVNSCTPIIPNDLTFLPPPTRDYDAPPDCTRKFTGKERDTETGLDYFGARYLSSNMGRFMTPDWADAPTPVPYANFGDPQSLNLYGYVKNNPERGIDVDGHDSFWTTNYHPSGVNAPLSPPFTVWQPSWGGDSQGGGVTNYQDLAYEDYSRRQADYFRERYEKSPQYKAWVAAHQAEIAMRQENQRGALAKELATESGWDYATIYNGLTAVGTIGGNTDFKVADNLLQMLDALGLRKPTQQGGCTLCRSGGNNLAGHLGLSVSPHFHNGLLHMDTFNGGRIPLGLLAHEFFDVYIGSYFNDMPFSR
jgi:RHS repeat-associated protein